MATCKKIQSIVSQKSGQKLDNNLLADLLLEISWLKHPVGHKLIFLAIFSTAIFNLVIFNFYTYHYYCNNKYNNKSTYIAPNIHMAHRGILQLLLSVRALFEIKIKENLKKSKLIHIQCTMLNLL